MKIDSIDLAYIAGFFDGEGSVTIHHNYAPSPRGKSPNHTLQVSIANTDPRVIMWVHDNFGGSLASRIAKKRNHRNVLQWIVRSNKAARFLSAIYPFVKMKREQIEIAISFQGSKSGYRKHRLSEDEIKLREHQKLSIQELNGRSLLQ